MTETSPAAVERLPRPQAGARPQVPQRGARAAAAGALRRRAPASAALDELTPALLDDFLASRPRPQPRSFNHLLGVVGCLLDWAVTQEPARGLAAAGPPSPGDRRPDPVPVRPAQARRLLDAAAALPDNPRAAARGPTYHAIFALCYGLGLRAGEACGLRLGDIDTGRAAARRARRQVRQEPPGPARAAHRRAGRRAGRRRRAAAGPPTHRPRCSASTGDDRVHPGTASQVFHRLVAALDLPVPDGVCPPRLHSLRHSFAVGCLLRWYREGLDPSTRLYQLSTFMGHVDPRSTAVYLTITPQLLAEANRRFEAFAAARLDRGGAMTETQPLGPILHSFFVDHLITVKGLRPASVRSYRDTIRLFLVLRRRRQGLQDHPADARRPHLRRVVAFLRHLEARPGQPRPHPQPAAGRPAHPVRLHRQPGTGDARRLPAGGRHPDEAGRPARDAVPRTRRGRGAAPPTCPATAGSRCGTGRCCCSSTTPAPASKRPPTCARGTSTSASTRWSACTARATSGGPARCGSRPHSCSTSLLGPCGPAARARTRRCSLADGQPLTRYGIYKIVRRHAASLDDPRTGRQISPHIFRHTAAVHLLEAGVEVNVIRGWLGHADLTTTNRYAEINTKTKLAALRATEPRCPGGIPHQPDLAVRRIAAQLARLALIIMWPAAAPAARSPPAARTASHRWPHNTNGHRTGITSTSIWRRSWRPSPRRTRRGCGCSGFRRTRPS